MRINVLALVIFIIVCQLAGAIGSVFTVSSIPDWYSKLEKPSFTPPNWAFGPVWITLYLLMAVSAYLVWSKGWDNPEVKNALLIFFFQLFLNILWSILFFGLKDPFFGLVEIVILWVAILLTIFEFHSISKPAAFLLIPYILWVTLASALNFFIWKLN